MPGSLTTPGRPGARDGAPGRVAFRKMHCVGTQDRKLSRLNGWPMRPPVNASPRPSRATAHDSGPMWTANPSSQGTCTLYSLPVSRRTHKISASPQQPTFARTRRAPLRAITGREPPQQSRLYSITSSARASSMGGISMLSARAVLRLMTSSYLVGACTGRSAGFSPLRMPAA